MLHNMVIVMTNQVTFLHAADLHLDSPFKGLTHIPDTIFSQVRESTFTALDNLVKTAIHKQVDFVLLVGDLFDNEKQSLKAQVQLRKAFETLEKNNIAVYISYGNHDYLNGNIHPMTYPDNVHIFPNEQISSFIFQKNNQKLASIYGFSYENQAVMTNKSLEYEVLDETIPFHIATLHGSIHGDKEHDPYAPFQLSDLRQQHFDYWALGHIHKRRELSDTPPIVYPGNTQGRHRNEEGEKGCYYVTLSETSVELEFVPLQIIQFEAKTIDVSDCTSLSEVEEKILQIGRNTTTSKLVSLSFYSNNENIINYHHEGFLKELIEIVNDSMLVNENWTYIYHYRLELEEKEKQDYGEFFIGEIIKSLDKIEMEVEIADLYKHPQARRFLEKLSSEEIKIAAKQFLLYELLKVEEGESS